MPAPRLRRRLRAALRAARVEQWLVRLERKLGRLSARRRRRRAEWRAFYARFVGEGDLCFDVGAFHGERTGAFLELGARVVCVEPQPSCQRVLHALFDGEPRVEIVECAVGAAAGELPFAICDEPTLSTLSPAWQQDSRFSADHDWSQQVPVQVVTLDSLIERHGTPRFCKIDVEGYERQALEGLTRPLPGLSFEFTRELLDDARHCIERAAAKGPARFNCTWGEGRELAYPGWLDAVTLMQELEARPEPLLWGEIYIERPAGD